MPDHQNDAVQSDDKTEEMAREIYMRWCARVGHLMLALPPRAAARMARDVWRSGGPSRTAYRSRPVSSGSRRTAWPRQSRSA